jgi:transposase-like protein
MRPNEFQGHLDALPKMSLQQIQRLSKEAALLARKAAVRLEIEKRAGDHPHCPYCGKSRSIRWGTSTGLQRWRCRICLKTFNSAHGSGLACTKRRAAFFALATDMMTPSPLSCRMAALIFGVNKTTIWRWRMKICTAVAGCGADVFSGIVEADETFQRESRKGSREWVEHEKDPILFPQPPRRRWYEYKEGNLPMKRGLSRWQVPVMTVMDRHGGRRAEVLRGLSYKHIAGALHDRVAKDAILCSDKAQGYKKFAAVEGIRHEPVAARRGERVRDGTFHIQTTNALHGRFKEFITAFDGPATRNLPGYAAWFVFRDMHQRDPDGATRLLARVLDMP